MRIIELELVIYRMRKQIGDFIHIYIYFLNKSLISFVLYAVGFFFCARTMVNKIQLKGLHRYTSDTTFYEK